MGHFVISLHKLLRLKPVFQAVVWSAAYLNTAKRDDSIISLVEDQSIWARVFYVVRLLFPGLCLLHLSDLAKPAMAWLLSHYTRQTESALEISMELEGGMFNSDEVCWLA